MHIYKLLFIATLLNAFPAIAAELSANDKLAIIKIAGLTEENGKYFTMACDEKTESELIVEDLNKDEQPEAFIRSHGMCLGGGAGIAISLYIKDAKGEWKANLGFPGDYKILDTNNLGYPDLEISGPGFCFPVWRWNGEAYDLYKRCEQ